MKTCGRKNTKEPDYSSLISFVVAILLLVFKVQKYIPGFNQSV